MVPPAPGRCHGTDVRPLLASRRIGAEAHVEDRPTGMRGRRAVAVAGTATAVATIGLLHPVLDVLGRHPAFFVARTDPRRDVLVVALALGLVVPALLWAALLLTRHLPAVVTVAVAAPVSAIGLGSVGAALVPAAPLAGAGAGAVAGVAATVAVARTPATWSVARWGAAVPVVALVLFLVGPVSAVLWRSPAVVGPATPAARPVPVVVLVLDELPTASLLDGPVSIDAERFPNISAFAEDAVWYRNATTVTDRTSLAVPAILTGMRAAAHSVPVAADHPQSIFTLLAPSHDVHAVEPVTALCPDGICVEATRAGSTPGGAAALASDIGVVAAHVVLPDAWTAGLPAIDRAWGGFAEDGARPDAHDGPHTEDAFDLGERVMGSSLRDRREDLRGVVRPPGARPPAYVLHTMLPHVPYRYLPSGQEVLPAPLVGLTGSGIWTADAWPRDHAHRQHLLQAGTADRVVGEVLDDLRAAALYEDALIVVVADHGVAFRAGADRRRATARTLPDIAAVPLLVRYPDGPRGLVDERPVETIDILPTVADVVGAVPARPFHGTSLRAEPARPAVRTIDAFDDDLRYTAADADPWLVAERTRQRFGDGWPGLYASVPDGELVGRAVDDLDVGPSPVMLATVDHREQLRRATPTSSPVVGTVTGGLAFAEPPSAPVRVAVAFDGTVVAVGRTTTVEGDTAAYQALLDPRWYAGGVDRIEVYVVDGAGLRGPLLDPGDAAPTPWTRSDATAWAAAASDPMDEEAGCGP